MLANSYIILASTLGALLTYYFQSRGFSAVLASCLVGVLGVLIAKLVAMPTLEVAVFTGSFVGMTSVAVLDYQGVGIAGLLSGALLLLLTDKFVGMGGKLGTMAFVSVCVVLLFIKILNSQT